MKGPSRAITTAAVGVLLLDAILLTYAGVALRRPGLLVWAVVCLALAGVALLAWRRYRRAMNEIAVARREMRHDIEAIRELLHRHHLHN